MNKHSTELAGGATETKQVEKPRREFPPRWLLAVVIAAIVAGGYLGISAQVTSWRNQQVAQANAQYIAEDIKRICATSGELRLDDRDICPKANQILQDPTQPIPGPKGDPGKDGGNGLPGLSGKDGKDSTVPGPPGTAGTDGADSTVPGPQGAAGIGIAGLNGADSTVPGPPGPPGADGADSTIPGPAGPPGPAGVPGADGAPGQAPQSFAFTDATGTSYTCVPVPPGSLTYTCTSAGPPPAPAPEPSPATPPGG